jgi:Asp-tRNA(Asn)/Glu-tRNA(Gln) amidotransferase A subunit family amidase
MNPYLLGFLKFLMQRLQPRVAMVLNAAAKLPTHEYLQKVGRLYELRTEWINYWRKNQLDFVICPGFGLQATNHGFSKECDLVAAYTYIWNVFAMTSCSLPVTITREDEQYYESHWEDDFTTAIRGTVGTSAGLPVNIQVVGLPFSEEKVLGLSKKIESHFQFLKKHPLPSLEP